MIETELACLHRSCVNPWECDENAHLNVRFYVGKNYQGVQHLLGDGAFSPSRLETLGMRARLASQHIRFHREARVAVPLVGLGQVVAYEAGRLKLYSEIRHGQDDTLYTTFNSEIEFVGLDDCKAQQAEFAAPEPAAKVPDYAAIRTLHSEAQPRLSLNEALARGYFETGRGVVMNEDCDAQQRMEIYQYTARISDAIPSFMSTMQSEEEFALRSRGELGGAVVESRVDYYAELKLGERFVVVSALRAFTEKTLRLSHLMFNLDSQALILHSQGIGIALDLKTRRAVPFSADRKTRMQARLLRDA